MATANLDSPANLNGIKFQEPNFAWLYRETLFALERYAKLAKEGKCLGESINFARYILQSGVVDVLKAHPQESPKVDGFHICYLAEELQHTVQAFYVSKKLKPTVEISALEAIHHKLDIIAGRLAQMPSNAALPAQVVDNGGQNTVLKVI